MGVIIFSAEVGGILGVVRPMDGSNSEIHLMFLRLSYQLEAQSAAEPRVTGDGWSPSRGHRVDANGRVFFWDLDGVRFEFPRTYCDHGGLPPRNGHSKCSVWGDSAGRYSGEYHHELWCDLPLLSIKGIPRMRRANPTRLNSSISRGRAAFDHRFRGDQKNERS